MITPYVPLVLRENLEKVGNPRHKIMCRERICVGSSGACRPNVLTFGCWADMSPTSRRLSQPRRCAVVFAVVLRSCGGYFLFHVNKVHPCGAIQHMGIAVKVLMRLDNTYIAGGASKWVDDATAFPRLTSVGLRRGEEGREVPAMPTLQHAGGPAGSDTYQHQGVCDGDSKTPPAGHGSAISTCPAPAVHGAWGRVCVNLSSS